MLGIFQNNLEDRFNDAMHQKSLLVLDFDGPDPGGQTLHVPYLIPLLI